MHTVFKKNRLTRIHRVLNKFMSETSYVSEKKNFIPCAKKRCDCLLLIQNSDNSKDRKELIEKGEVCKEDYEIIEELIEMFDTR